MRNQCTAPSTSARNGAIVRTQTTSCDEAVYNGRPLTLLGPYLYIYHRVFADFQQKLRRPLESAGLTTEDLQHAEGFIERSARFYPTKMERLDSIKGYVETFLGIGALSQMRLRTGSVPYMPDGMLLAVCGLYSSTQPGVARMLKLVVELTDGIGLGGCDPARAGRESLPTNVHRFKAG